MTEPIVVVATFRPVPESWDELSSLVAEYVPEAQQEPGNVRYALHDAGQGVLVLVEQWESQDALEAHGAAPRFTAFSEAVRPLLESPLEVRVLRPRPLGDATKGAL